MLCHRHAASSLHSFFFFGRWEGQTLSGWPHTQQLSKPSCRGPKAKPHTRSSRRHAAPFQEVPSTRTKNSMGVEPTHLLGVLQREAAHTRLTEASRPNKGVRKAVQATRKHAPTPSTGQRYIYVQVSGCPGTPAGHYHCHPTALTFIAAVPAECTSSCCYTCLCKPFPRLAPLLPPIPRSLFLPATWQPAGQPLPPAAACG